MIRLQVDRLPSGAIPKPVWWWYSRTDLDPAEVDLARQAFLRRFDVEHTFRMLDRRNAASIVNHLLTRLSVMLRGVGVRGRQEAELLTALHEWSDPDRPRCRPPR
ncbi:hypothetical protein [Umezawaea beigongshangensis]|uniref:hypothetical protein n=1 Tax=Umezawaea beigongshangensis TaxID=2780383 RepID=UPI0018F1CC4A|nr:hypothetical protein [Umezawaea beigongshangensis]